MAISLNSNKVKLISRESSPTAVSQIVKSISLGNNIAYPDPGWAVTPAKDFTMYKVHSNFTLSGLSGSGQLYSFGQSNAGSVFPIVKNTSSSVCSLSSGGGSGSIYVPTYNAPSILTQVRLAAKHSTTNSTITANVTSWRWVIFAIRNSLPVLGSPHAANFVTAANNAESIMWNTSLLACNNNVGDFIALGLFLLASATLPLTFNTTVSGLVLQFEQPGG